MEALIHAAEKAPALLPTVIYTDSKQAIRNLNDRPMSNTSAARRRFMAASIGKRFKVCWVPGHDKVEGNRRADALAKRAHNEEGLHQQSTTAGTPLRNLHAIYRARVKARTNEVATPTVTTSAITQRAAMRGRTIGRFTKRVDASYASGHTKDLYDALTAAQLRTGIVG